MSTVLPLITHFAGLDETNQAANHCVACGLCLSHCPTYRKTKSEADSPRGRIALMKGVLENRLSLSERFIQHIDLCMTCRACENACPSKVEYGRAVDGVRQLIKQKRPNPSGAKRYRALSSVVNNPFKLRSFGRAIRLYQQSGLQYLLRKSSLLQRFGLAGLEAELPELPEIHNWKEIYPALGSMRAEVGLFLGCVARLTDVEVLNASVFVLNRLGYTVHVPKQQGCCGAMHQHAGFSDESTKSAKQNSKAFEGLKLSAVISVASGCGAMLSEYNHLISVEGADIATKVMDVSAFLSQAEGWEGITLDSLDTKIRVQDPCTLRNVLHAEKSVYTLLGRIPLAEIEPLEGNDQCCGAAGLYHLQQPEMAGLLRDDKLNALRQCDTTYLATSNVGCALWLAQGLRSQGMQIEVIHPVTLLARQMGFTGKC
ncbi:(Fe-S)-binding protein [Sulfurirhabdus autotrophica]|nr:(Fe-S)-binding protein [Sulfurirhabdus autotrophica]